MEKSAKPAIEAKDLHGPDFKQSADFKQSIWECLLLVLLFFSVAGASPPSVNEAHYLTKAKHFWNPDWLGNDAFVSSRDAHTVFFATVGALTQWFDLATTAWIGRFLGWIALAVGLNRLCTCLFRTPYASLGVVVIWMVGVQHLNLAGEWIVGGIEGKVIAYGFVLAGLSDLALERWNRVWLMFGAASAFHVLVGGWGVVAGLLVRAALIVGGNSKLPRVTELAALVAGGAISLLGLIPSLQLTQFASASEQNYAAQIYVFGRLGHHLTIASFPNIWIVRHLALIGATWLLYYVSFRYVDSSWKVRLRPIFYFAAASVLLAGIGALLSILPALSPSLSARLLRFYWFRMTDAFVPLATGICVVSCLVHIGHQRRDMSVVRGLRVIAVSVLIVCTFLIGSKYLRDLERSIPEGLEANLPGNEALGVRTQLFSDQNVIDDWLEVCLWVRSSTRPDSVFLTPRHQQTFKWFAQRAEVVSWKDVPQDAVAIIDWAKRINRVFPAILGRRHTPVDKATLGGLARDYGVEFLIVDRRVVAAELSLPQVFPRGQAEKSVYVVYSLKSLRQDYREPEHRMNEPGNPQP